MARIKKYSPEQNLSSFGTFLIDNNPNSDYFRITEFNDTFTGGKNGFLIEGSQYLKESTEIKIEILDVNGDPIYYEPGNGIPEYYEGISKLIAVYVYEDTPIGLGKITVLGELKQYVDNNVIRDIPEEWKNAYNVKWERTFQVNKNLANEDRVRFYRRPQVEITEINKPIFNNNSVSLTKTGTINGVPLVPFENATLTGFSLPTSYRLNIASGDNWTGSIVGQTITLDNLNYSSVIDDIVSDTEIIVNTPYTQNGIVKSFTNEDYSVTFNYLEGVTDLATALTGSFAKINITDMKTFVGDAARVKIFRRSQSNLTDYEFVQDLQLESNELLRDIETVTATEEYYGNLTDIRLDNYWLTSSNAVSVEFNRDFLYNSAKINSNEGTYFFTTQSLSIQQGVEYTLNLNLRKSQNTTGDFIKVFLSGSLNGTPVSQPITTIDSSTSILQKVNLSENIIANQFDNARLYFEVEGSDWYISDISFKASQETSFSPDEITFVQTVPKTLQKETFDYRFEFYDINNNYIPITVEKTKTFDGGNLNLYNKSLTITPNQLYFAFDSASAPANPLPPTTITFDIETNVITGSVTYTSGAYDEFGEYLSASQYAGGQYPGLLKDINTLTPTLSVADFTGSRDDITVQYIRFTGEVEGVTDEVVITRVADGKGGVNFEIRPYRGTIIKNSSDNELEVQAIRIDGVNEIVLRDGLVQRGYSDAKLRVLSSSFDSLGQPTSSYYLLSEAVQYGFLQSVVAGTTGSGEIDYNATFNRDSINGELTLFLMDGPTENDILTSLILTDLQDGLASGFISFDSEQYGIRPRTEREFTPNIGRVSGSFYLRGTNESPISGTLNIYPSMSVDPETIAPYYYMFYVTDSFDRRISIEVTDFENNIINSGIPGQNGIPFYAATETKQLTTKFTYLEDVTSASISIDKTFFAVPDGNPGDDAILVNITPNPVTLNADQRGRVFSYETANTDITVTQGFLPLIFTSSKKPGTFTTSSIIPRGIQYSTFDEIMGDASMSISGFSSMTDLTASVEYQLEIHPFYTASYYTQSFFQQFQKSIDGAAAINIELEPTIIALSAEENGGVFDYTTANTTLRVKQGDEYLEYNPANLPGTFTASISLTNISVGLLTSSKTLVTENGLSDTMNFVSMSNMSDDSASIDYSILVRPFSITNGIVTGSQLITRTQSFTKQKEGVKARSVSLSATSAVVNFDGDGVVTAPLGSIFLTATPFNVTASQTYYQYFQDGFAYSTISTDDVFEIGSGDATSPGETATWQVQMRDGNINSEVIATAEVTITGIKAGANNYQVSLTNDNTSVLVEVDGTTTLDGTGTQITVLKGTETLTHVSTYSEQTLDLTGEPIGSLGEYSASLYSKPYYITQTNIPTGNPAAIGPIQFWDTPQTNTSATIVYKVDVENGRATYFLSQSLSAVFEGATGPGVVFRGPWNDTIEYIYNKDAKRRDAVLYSVSGGEPYDTYYATADSGSSYLVPINTPPTVGGVLNEAYWVSLGQEEFFVAAKIAIFEESFVKNTINVGSPATSYDVNPQITIYGADSEPYISIGQSIQGYGQKGVYIGVTEDGGPNGTAGTTGLLSIENSDGTRHLRWDGNELNVAGIVSASAGIFGGWVIDPSGIYFPTQFPVGYIFNTSTTVTVNNALYAGLNTVVADGSTWATRGGTLDNSGSALLTAFGSITTRHRVTGGNNSNPSSPTLTLTNGLYAANSPYELSFYRTGSLDIQGYKLRWPAGTNYLEPLDLTATPIPYTTWLSAVAGDFEVPSHLKSTIIKANGVMVPSAGVIADFPAMKIYGYAGGDNTKLLLSGSNPYGSNVNFDTAAAMSIFYPKNESGFYRYTQGSVTAGTRTDNIISGEGMRLSTSGSLLNKSSKPYLSMGQLSQSFDEIGVFLGFPSGSDDPLFSLRSKDGAYLSYNGDGVNFSGTIQGSTINGSKINGGELKIGLKEGSTFDYNFSVDANGNVSASNANMSGIINANSGRIGQWIIDPSTGNLQNSDGDIIFDPILPEIQLLDNGDKKVIISPSTTLTSTGGSTETSNFSTGPTFASPISIDTLGTSQGFVTSNFMVSNLSDTAISVGTGPLEIQLDIPSISVAIPPEVSHTTSYPSYLPSFTGQRHGGFSNPAYSQAELFLEAIDATDGTLRGRTSIAIASAQSAYNVGNYYDGTSDYTPPGGGGGGGGGYLTFQSVTGDTKITLSSGETILAKDVTEGQKILAWSWNDKLDNSTINQFDEFEIQNIKSRRVDTIYKVTAGGKTIKVSDSHGFWLNDNQQIKTTELVVGVSMINIKDDNGIKLVLVDNVEIIETDEWVYTFGVPGVHNYVSNDIISHNSGTWEYVASSFVSGVQYNSSALSGQRRIINMLTSGDVKFRYSIRFSGYSGLRVNIGSDLGAYSDVFQIHTIGPSIGSPSYDTSLAVATPSNFVEIKAGGVQVVSEPNSWVRIPRKPVGDTNPEIFRANGGTSYFKSLTNGGAYDTAINSDGDIIPAVASNFDIGANSNRFLNVYSDTVTTSTLTGLGTQQQSHSPGSNTTTSNYQKLADGSIIQWGHLYDTTDPKQITFPVTFASAPSVTCATYRNGPGASGTNYVYNLTTSGASLVLDEARGYWIAVGYV
jgi:hypothetical protein